MNPEKYLPWLKAIGVIVIALVIAYYVGTRTGKAKKESAADDILKKEIDKSAISFEQTQYSAYADKLESAMTGFSDNEKSIYAIIGKLNNKSDVLSLIKAFGQRRQSFSVGGANLITWFNNRLESSEIAEINDILSRKGIDYQF